MTTLLQTSLTSSLTDAQWEQYTEDGYLKLGKLLSDKALNALQTRIDDIMLGKVQDYSKIWMQLDSESGNYGELSQGGFGHKGATLNYRKIEGLEFDDVFHSYMTQPLFQDLCKRVYSRDTPIASFRSMFMNKPANRGTFLPFHQDRWTDLDRDPLLTSWTALDPATIENGCVQVIPKSHKLGLINPAHPSGFLTAEQASEYCRPENIVHLELEAGEVVLLHNWLLHGSDRNNSATSRRAFSVCYMDANTVSARGTQFTHIF